MNIWIVLAVGGLKVVGSLVFLSQVIDGVFPLFDFRFIDRMGAQINTSNDVIARIGSEKKTKILCFLFCFYENCRWFFFKFILNFWKCLRKWGRPKITLTNTAL